MNAAPPVSPHPAANMEVTTLFLVFLTNHETGPAAPLVHPGYFIIYHRILHLRQRNENI